MSTYVPFPELASAIHGAPIEEAIETFKEIAKIVISAHYVKKMEADDTSDGRRVKSLLRALKVRMQAFRERTYLDGPNRDFLRPHLLSSIGIAKTFDMIYAHVDKIIGRPEHILFVQGGEEVTAAEDWLVRCAMQGETDLEFCRTWSQYLEKQPVYPPDEEAEWRYHRQVAELANDTSINFPSLFEALRRFVGPSAELFDTTGVFVVLREYLSIGATAASVWAHMWQEHGIQRGQPLAVDDHHLKVAMEQIEKYFGEYINDWESTVPLRVRRVLAEHNFSGDFLFLANHVFPTAIAPSSSDITEDMFDRKMHQYIINAATAAGIDPEGRIARLIQQCDLLPRHSNRHPLISTFVSFLPSDQHQGQDVELEAYGPLLKVDYITKPGVPSDSSICTICQQDSSADGESPCVQLSACEHLFHWDCLHIWVNGLHKDDVQCPNCRKKICHARPQRRKGLE